MNKSVKRIFALLLSAVMIFAAIPSACFAAQDETVYAPIEFSITSVKGVANKNVHVEVRVSENSQIASMNLELNFDSSKLLVTDYAAGELMASGLSAINANVSDKIIVSFASMEPITEAGTLFGVDFDVTTTEVNDIIDMSITAAEVTDINGDDLTSSTSDGIVEVVDLLYGDVTFDNRITAVDALKVLASVTEEITLTEDEAKAGDVNGDGEVSVSDALQMLYFSAEIVNDFAIYNLTAPDNVHVAELDGYQFTVEWDHMKDVLGYNVYLDGELVNAELLTDNYIAIGVDMNGEYGSELIPNRVHDSIAQVTDYDIEVTAINSLKESDKCEILTVTTKRIWSWVTFVDWDGTVLKKARVYYGEDAIEPNAPTREDYFFTGWDKETTNITDDTVITATYEDAHYDFVFFNEDGSELYRQSVTVNGTATPPAEPTKAGHTFSGWYTAPTGGEKVESFIITSATGERKVYAQYTINSYTVTFDSNGGTVVGSQMAVYNTTTTVPQSPTKLGFGFGGWYKDKACTNKWNFSTDVVLYGTTLYAKWNPVVISIDKASVTLNAAGDTSQLTATITGGSDSLTWSSSNTAVATVDTSGKITAVGHGTATIYVQGVASERRPVTKVTVNVAKNGWCTYDAVNIRSGPSTGYGVVGQLFSGNKITVYGDMTAAGVSGQKGWYSIRTSGGINGYVSANYITFTEPPAFVAVGAFGKEKNVNGVIYNTIAGFEQYIICQNQYDGNTFGTGYGNVGCTATCSSMVIAMCTGKAPANPTSSYYWKSGVGATWSGLKTIANKGASQATVFNAVKNTLTNNNRPCIVYFNFNYKNSKGAVLSTMHAVVVVGIRKGANANALKPADLLIVDPSNAPWASAPNPSKQIKTLQQYFNGWNSFALTGYNATRTYNG
ncbi:MAG: InlB B-repeat-containing protein [Clostridia bacterium]|nr:InlB B-repeat-containing protein [Clostridia bacterium]